MEILNRIELTGIIPVMVVEDLNEILPITKALINGGLDILEVTFRNDNAVDAILKMKQAFPNILVGAGTVINKQQVDNAVKVGADFIVCPGFDETVVSYCISRKILVIPGCTTPTDIEKAVLNKLDVVKFFPAESFGGMSTINALSGPFKNVRFIPTGGINEINMNSYLNSNKVIACGGSWMLNATTVSDDKYKEIEEYAKKTVQELMGLKFNGIEDSFTVLKTKNLRRAIYYLNKMGIILDDNLRNKTYCVWIKEDV